MQIALNDDDDDDVDETAFSPLIIHRLLSVSFVRGKRRPKLIAVACGF